ncbi:uncharacterized protein LOC141647765 [Silene latifolia]|uniref:uncharacterized protein LOC141647765 n=1 Tax=Silene latifolia TaxID=37657 RepID=UPI003D770FDA
MGFETIINVNGYGNGFKNSDVNGNGGTYGYHEIQNGHSQLINGSSSKMSSSSSPIEHHVTKMDTLAGIAIRYGVEVADIKKMNGLVTDLQMYALKTLQIPLPGRHPPSHCLSNGRSSVGSDETPSRQMQSDVHESFQSLKLTPDRKLSPAMCSLRDYYGLNSRRNSSESYEMAVYNKGSTRHQENEAFSSSSASSTMNLPFSQHRRSRSVANGFKTEEDDLAINVDAIYRKYIGKLNTHTEKTEETRTPEKLLKEENGSGGWFSAMTGKGLALRTKAASRTNLASEGELGGANGFPNNLGDYIMGEGTSRVRKSSSTPSLQDQDGNGNLSIWKTSTWSLKPDLQALANPIFDGLPKPMSGRKSKAALD